MEKNRRASSGIILFKFLVYVSNLNDILNDVSLCWLPWKECVFIFIMIWGTRQVKHPFYGEDSMKFSFEFFAFDRLQV